MSKTLLIMYNCDIKYRVCISLEVRVLDDDVIHCSYAHACHFSASNCVLFLYNRELSSIKKPLQKVKSKEDKG